MIITTEPRTTDTATTTTSLKASPVKSDDIVINPNSSKTTPLQDLSPEFHFEMLIEKLSR